MTFHERDKKRKTEDILVGDWMVLGGTWTSVGVYTWTSCGSERHSLPDRSVLRTRPLPEGRKRKDSLPDERRSSDLRMVSKKNSS